MTEFWSDCLRSFIILVIGAVKKSRITTPGKPILPCSFSNKLMIIIHLHGVNDISQKEYDRIFELIDIHCLQCPSCEHAGMTVHAYYDRRVKASDGTFRLVVIRVLCSFCGKTHAILPDTVVPYSSVTMKDTINIVLADSAEAINTVFDENPCLDYSDIRHVQRNFRCYWKERLNSFGITIQSDISRTCIRLFHRQFMQIRCTLCGSYG